MTSEGRAGVSVSRAFRQTLGANVVIAGLNLVTGIVAARLLGPNGRGELAAIQLWPMVLATLAMLGLPEALVYFTARAPKQAGSYLGSAVVMALLASLLFGLVGLVLLPVVLSNQSNDVVSAAQRYLLLIPLWALALLPTHPLRGKQEFWSWNVLRVAPSAAWLLILLGARLQGDPNAGELADANLVALALLSLAVVWTVRRKIGRPYRPQVEVARSLLRFGLPAVGAMLPQLLNFRVDQLLMAAVLPPRDLGLYVVAVAWGWSVNPLLTALGMTLFPHVASQETLAGKHAVMARAYRLGFVATLLTCTVICAATPIAIRVLFSSRFEAAVVPAMILVLAGGVSGYNFILAEGIRGLGKPMVTLWSELAGLAVTFVSLAVLLPTLGIVGASLASLLSYGVVTAVLLRGLSREGLELGRSNWRLPGLGEIRDSWRLVRHTGGRVDVAEGSA